MFIRSIVCIVSFLSVFSDASLYLRCNASQAAYFENERMLFGLDNSTEPFEKQYFTTNVSYFPTSCINDDDNDILHYPNTIKFISQYINKIETPLKFNQYIPGYAIGRVTDFVWTLAGYKQISYNNEQFWYRGNNKASSVVLFFHGINAANGVENLYLLNKLGKNNSVYVSIYQPSFIADYFNYNSTYSQHIDDVISFIKTELYNETVTIVGNSFGSIRATTLCKRYDCSGMSNIILTDPVNINFPYSKTFASLFHGALMKSNLTKKYRMIGTINILREEKHYRHAENNFDWYEWSIDTIFMNYYKTKLIIVIGKYDNLISLNETSYAMTKICRVIYTNTLHGFVLFSDFMDYVG